MKKLLFISALCIISLTLQAQLQVVNNNYIKLFGSSKGLHTGPTGKYGSATIFDFNTDTQSGVMLEYGASESAGIYLDGDYAVIWSPGDNGRLLRIYDEDDMHAGSTDYEKFYIDGDGDFYKASDLNRKEKINNLNDATGKLLQLRGVTYSYKLSEQEKEKKLKAKKRYGFIAQELEAVIPEVVDTDEYGNKFVNYTSIIPVLVDGFKEQQAQIDEQQIIIDKMLQEIVDLKAKISK